MQCRRGRRAGIGWYKHLLAQHEGKKLSKHAISNQYESSRVLCLFTIDVCGTASPWIRCRRGYAAGEGILGSTPLRDCTGENGAHPTTLVVNKCHLRNFEVKRIRG